MTGQRTAMRSARSIISFDLVLPAQYGLSTGKHGLGKTERISCRHLFLTCGEILPVGARIEVHVAWPVLCDGSDPMTLYIQGVVESQDANTYEISFSKHEFVKNGNQKH